jgi:hypothetical protein
LFIDYEEDPDYVLTQKGLDILYTDICEEQFESNLNDHGFMWSMNEKDGIIDIWRAVDYGFQNKKDTYENIMEYEGVGHYWSWEKGGAYAHGGHGSGEIYILCAKVKAEHVDWEKTIFKNAYALKDEMEIELNQDAKVLLYDVRIDEKYDWKKKKRYPEKSINIEPMIVPA